jgi:hypothetical protein
MFRYGRIKHGGQTIRRIRIDRYKDGRSMKLRISKILPTFTVEALAIGETPEIIERIGSEQNFVIFSDSASVLKDIGSSHIAHYSDA